MHHTIESLIQSCQSAISAADNPPTVVEVAGFGTLIQRLDSTHVFLDTVRTFLADKETTVADRVAAKVVPMFMKVEDADTIESRQEAWNALYMYISALNFVSVRTFIVCTPAWKRYSSGLMRIGVIFARLPQTCNAHIQLPLMMRPSTL